MFLHKRALGSQLDEDNEGIIRTIGGLVDFLPRVAAAGRRGEFATDTATMVYSSVVIADQLIDSLGATASTKSELAWAYTKAFELDMEPALRLSRMFPDPAAVLFPAAMFEYAGTACERRPGFKRVTSTLQSLLRAGYAEFAAETPEQTLRASEEVGAVSSSLILQSACVDHSEVDPKDSKAIALLGSIMNIVDDIHDWPVDLQRGAKTVVTTAADPATGEELGYERCCQLFGGLRKLASECRLNNFRGAIGWWWLRNALLNKTASQSDFRLIAFARPSATRRGVTLNG